MNNIPKNLDNLAKSDLYDRCVICQNEMWGFCKVYNKPCVDVKIETCKGGELCTLSYTRTDQ